MSGMNTSATRCPSDMLLTPAYFSPTELLTPDKLISSPTKSTANNRTASTNTLTVADGLPPASPVRNKRVRRRSRHSQTNSPTRVASPDVAHRAASSSTVDIQEVMERLRKENYRLLEDNLKKTFEFCVNNRENARPLQSLDANQAQSKHIDSLISKQCEEINSLKLKIAEQESQHEKTIHQLQLEYSNRERQLLTERANQQEVHRRQAVEQENEIAVLKEEHQSQLQLLSLKSSSLQSELSDSRSELSALKSSLPEQERIREQLALQISKSESEIQSKDQTITSLRSRLESYQQREADKERWPSVKADLQTRLTIVESERNTLQLEMEHLNTRLESINQVLTIQQDSLKNSTADDNNKLHILLDRWRNKVFQLLVQQKSAELCIQKELTNRDRDQSSLRGHIRSLESRVRELEVTVEERDCQITYLNKIKQDLENTLQTTSQHLDMMEEEKQRLEEAVGQLAEVLMSYQERYTEQCGTLDLILVRLSKYEDKIICANNDLHRCQDVIRLKTESLRKADILASELQQEVSELKQRLSTAESSSSHYQSKVEGLQTSLLRLNSELEAKESGIHELRDELDVIKANTELQVKKRLLDIENDYKSRLEHSDLTISDLRRELAKTIVCLRQTEKRLNTEKQLHCQELSSLTDHASAKVAQLQTDVQSLQTERQILHTNLTALNAIKHRTAPVTSKNFPVERTCQSPVPASHSRSTPVSPQRNAKEAALCLAGSVKKLAAGILNSDTDSEDSADEE